QVLYVRWLVPLIDHQSGISHAQLPKVTFAFVNESDCDAFGFLNPSQVIQSTHLIPAFTSGHGTSSLHHGQSFTCHSDELDNWESYYIVIFVDQDMFM
ncbi:hypothetical protein BDR04DRAFT_1024951, partial [Suillus decipiens]